MKARSLKVKIKTLEHVKKIFFSDNLWNVQTETWTYQGGAVILAGGSKASAVAGADGSCYALASELGHQIIKPLPALTGLKCQNSSLSLWAGVRTEAAVQLFIDGNLSGKETGEVQLTEYGISGIPVFQLSRYVARALAEKKQVQLSVNFLPEYTEEILKQLMKKKRTLSL